MVKKKREEKLIEFEMIDSSNLSSSFRQIYYRGISSNTTVNAVLRCTHKAGLKFSHFTLQ